MDDFVLVKMKQSMQKLVCIAFKVFKILIDILFLLQQILFMIVRLGVDYPLDVFSVFSSSQVEGADEFALQDISQFQKGVLFDVDVGKSFSSGQSILLELC